MSTADEALVERWRAHRDPDAFAEIAARYAGLVYATCRRILGDASAAEDVAQECFLDLASGKARIRTSLGGWLHAAATHRALNRLRADRRRVAREARYVREASAHDKAAWNDVQQYVDEAVAALPDDLRDLLVRHFFAGESYAGLADSLGIPRSTVAHRVQQGVERIRHSLRGRGIAVPAAALAGMLAAQAAEAAPQALTASLARLALAGTTGHAAATTGPLATAGVLLMKAKLILGACLVLAVVGAFLMAQPEESPAKAVAPTAPPKAATPAPPPVVQAEYVPDPPQPEPVVVPPADEPQGTAAVAGTVRDAEGRPLAGARVEARRRESPSVLERTESGRGMWVLDTLKTIPYHLLLDPPRVAAAAVTGKDGAYRLDGLPAGEDLMLTALHPDRAYGALELEPLRIDEARHAVDFRLGESEPLSGIVVDESGAPVAGAQVTLWGMCHEESPRKWLEVKCEYNGGMTEVTSAEDGTFSFDGVPRDWYVKEITARRPGYGFGVGCMEQGRDSAGTARTFVKELDGRLEHELRIVLRKYAGVEGRVTVSGTDEPAADARIVLTDDLSPNLDRRRAVSSLSISSVTATDERGYYRFAEVPQGFVRVDAQWLGRVSRPKLLELAWGQQVTDAHLAVEAPGAIQGTVYDSAKGRPLANRPLDIYERDVRRSFPWHENTDTAGRYKFEGCRPGDFHFALISDGGRLAFDPQRHGARYSNMLPVSVRPGETTKLDLYLVPAEPPQEPVTVSGRVTDAQGRPVPGATIVSQYSEPVQTDVEGHYSFPVRGGGEFNVGALDAASMMFGYSRVKVEAESAQLHIQLAYPGGRISGRITMPDGRALPSCNVRLSPGGLSTTTDDKGNYVFAPVPPLGLEVLPSSEDEYSFKPDSQRVEPQLGEAVDGVNFVAEPMDKAVAGTVLLEDGSPAVSRSVNAKAITSARMVSFEPTFTDSAGRFRIENVGGEDLTIFVGHPPHENNPSGEPEWTVVEGVKPGTEDLVIRLVRTGVLTGVIEVPADEDYLYFQISDPNYKNVYKPPVEPGVPFRFNFAPGEYRLITHTENADIDGMTVTIQSGRETSLGIIALQPR